MAEPTLFEITESMRSMGDLLVPCTYPKVDFKTEQDVLTLKQRNIVVDGYEVLVCYSKADYGDYLLESFQLQGVYSPFLPFTIVCKLGRAFLGPDHLSYIEFYKTHRKVYCWTLKSRDGRPEPPDQKTKPGSFEGFSYHVLQPGSVDLF